MDQTINDFLSFNPKKKKKNEILSPHKNERNLSYNATDLSIKFCKLFIFG